MFRRVDSAFLLKDRKYSPHNQLSALSKKSIPFKDQGFPRADLHHQNVLNGFSLLGKELNDGAIFDFLRNVRNLVDSTCL